jgi:hypothetical protein
MIELLLFSRINHEYKGGKDGYRGKWLYGAT